MGISHAWSTSCISTTDKLWQNYWKQQTHIYLWTHQTRWRSTICVFVCVTVCGVAHMCRARFVPNAKRKQHNIASLRQKLGEDMRSHIHIYIHMSISNFSVSSSSASIKNTHRRKWPLAWVCRNINIRYIWLYDEYCIYVFGLLFNEERPTAKHTVCVCVVFVYDNFDGRKLCVWMNLIDDCVGFFLWFTSDAFGRLRKWK